MRALLIATMRRHRGVIRREDALARFPRHVVDDAVRSGALVIAHPGVYRLPEYDDLATRRRTALAFCRGGALSHTDALDIWGLPTATTPRVHVTVSSEVPQQSRSIHVHRRRQFYPGPPVMVVRSGLRVVRLEQAVIESWRWLPHLDRRAPAIVAVRERRTTGRRLLRHLDTQPAAAGAGAQRRLFTQLELGNHSELEIWGHEKVFNDRQLPRSLTQYRVLLGGHAVFLDRAFPEEMVAAELDGAAYHGAPGQRERDLRRDSALARLGWLTVRFSHTRLHADPAGVVEELLDILHRRRSQLAQAG